MSTDIEAAIKALTEKSHAANVPAHEAIHYTQAALNLAHVAQVLKQISPS